jgi:hypothetical protein
VGKVARPTRNCSGRALRPVLLGLAILIALLAAAVAILPWLIDPATVRDRVIVEIERAARASLLIDGSAELQLLPRPRLSLARVRLRDPTAGDGLIEADRLDLELRPWALLGGAPLVAGLRVVRPELRLDGEAGALAGRLGAALAQADGVDHLLVLDGRLQPPHGEPLEHLELELRRGAGGAVELDGIGRWREQPVALLARSSAAGPGAVTFDLRLTLGPSDSSASLSMRGTLRAAIPEVDAEVRVESAEAAIPVEATLALVGSREPVGHLRLGPLALDGRLRLAAEGWRIELRRLALAEGMLSGSLIREPREAPIELELAGDRLSVPDDLLGLLRHVATLPALRGTVPGKLQLRLGALELPDAVLRDLRVAAALDVDGVVRVEQLAAHLPGNSELSLEGTLTGVDGAPAWRGRGSLATEELRELLRWRGIDPVGVAPERLRRLDVKGAVDWSEGMLTLRELDLQLDANRAAGSLAVALSGRPQVAAALSMDRVDLDGYLPASPEQISATLAELARRLDLAVDLGAEVVSWQAARAERVRLVGDVTEGRVLLSELSVGDLGETSARLVGGGDLAAGTVELALDAEVARPARLLRLLLGEPPPLAGRLGPVRLTGSLRREARTRLQLQAAATGIGVDLELDLPGGLEPAPATLRLTAEAQRLGPVLQQLGLGGAVGPALDTPLALALTVERRDAARAEIVGELGVGASRVASALRLDASGRRPVITGTLDLPALDPAHLAIGWEIGEVALGFPTGPPARWPGAWPREPLLWDWLAASDLDLRLGGAAIGGANAAHLALREGALALELASLPLAGGRLSGNLRLASDNGTARLGIDGRLAAAEADQLLAIIGLKDSLTGRLDLETRLEAGGASLAALVGSLAGESQLRLRDGRILGMRAPWAEADAGPRRLDLVELEGPLRVERGVATTGADGLSLVSPDGQGRVELRLDLLAWVLEATIGGRGEGGPELRLVGPPGRVRAVPPAEPSPP